VVKDNYSWIVDRKKELVKDNAEFEAVLLENMMLPMRRSLESHCTARNNPGPTTLRDGSKGKRQKYKQLVKSVAELVSWEILREVMQG
jgi:hypothetical protein